MVVTLREMVVICYFRAVVNRGVGPGDANASKNWIMAKVFVVVAILKYDTERISANATHGSGLELCTVQAKRLLKKAQKAKRHKDRIFLPKG